VSFGTFPPHCIAGTHGAELAIEPGQTILLKGESSDADEFSAFGGGKNCSKIIGDEVYVIGLAGDYCVKQTLSDLLEYLPGKKLYAITDLIRSVDGSEYGKTDYFSGNVHFVTSADLI
jgi:nicotinamidase/pyrazinamidase